jgi:hypothetical protein
MTACTSRDILDYMRSIFLSNSPTGPSGSVGPRTLCNLALVFAMLGSGAAHGQINDTEGTWQGSLSCGDMQTAGGRSPKGFVSQIKVNVSLGAITGRRDTAEVIESFNGSINRSGLTTLEGSGHWKDDPRRAWRYRLKGTQSGSQMTLAGPLESQDGKTRLRDCQVRLTSAVLAAKEAREHLDKATPAARPAPPAARPAPPAASTQPAPAAPSASSPAVAAKPAPAADPAARTSEKPNRDKELAARQAADKAVEAERAQAAKRQSDEAAAAAAQAQAQPAEVEALRRKNLQLEAEKAAAERAEAAAADKAAADKAAGERITAERIAAERTAAEKAAPEKAAADKAARQKAEADARKAPIKVRSAMDL